MKSKWIAERLRMGTWIYVSSLFLACSMNPNKHSLRLRRCCRCVNSDLYGLNPLRCSASRQLVKMTCGTLGKGRPDAAISGCMSHALPLSDERCKP
jgi:hypothetical protein